MIFEEQLLRVMGRKNYVPLAADELAERVAQGQTKTKEIRDGCAARSRWSCGETAGQAIRAAG